MRGPRWLARAVLVLTQVDRRFNRSRYDAVRTIEQFSQRLRSSVDLAELRLDLQAVAATTMQPASMSMWLKRSP